LIWNFATNIDGRRPRNNRNPQAIGNSNGVEQGIDETFGRAAHLGEARGWTTILLEHRGGGIHHHGHFQAAIRSGGGDTNGAE
jgi:hypothetical protein